ncbi:leucyl aminopeptidase [Bacillus sp. AGMB 02131]|uniref:Probable cytosol aminopeptidase n=1 Tax=Peribacillus faecalis TaxID=2772559 RepID=A0A927CWQ2_9BACI|nr:leucyl aminopeptidase [Peribacillus faecalis]MBD3109033.1 leucyl aminopeptidase [Peribacillus faecalis]
MFSMQTQWNREMSNECLIVGLHKPGNPLSGVLAACDEAMDQHISQLIKSGDISDSKKSITLIHTLGKVMTKRIIVIGFGRENQVTEEDWKEALGMAFRKVKELRLNQVSIDLDSLAGANIPLERAAQLLGEVYMLSLYTFDGYKQNNIKAPVEIKEITLLSESGKTALLQENAHLGAIYGSGTNYARTLVNLPPNILTATKMAEYAKELANQYQFELEVLNKEEMERLGMGALLAVNQGSVEPPAMIVLKYQGKSEWKDVIGLVGKGITYDTGGYSLKPRESMVGMKTDMGGAAAVLGAMRVIGELKPEQNVVAVIASTDNVVSAEAFKPDDVIVSLSGKTIEVLNTDAEGRLVLADAVTYAKQHGADYLVDVATLTGGVIVALGNEMTGVFTNNDEFLKKVKRASEKSGEPMWQLPITAKDRERVRGSKIADLNNSPGREGHAIMGAAFVGEFAENTPWVHLDIAGTSVSKKSSSLHTHGATGVMAKTLAQLVVDFSS